MEMARRKYMTDELLLNILGCLDYNWYYSRVLEGKLMKWLWLVVIEFRVAWLLEIALHVNYFWM